MEYKYARGGRPGGNGYIARASGQLLALARGNKWSSQYLDEGMLLLDDACCMNDILNCMCMACRMTCMLSRELP